MTTFGVPESVLGHLFQHRYALWLLLRAVRERPAVELSIERADDIALDEGVESLARVQTKHTLVPPGASPPTALSDSSPEIWKTLRVWSEALESGTLPLPGTILTLVTTGVASSVTAAAMLRPANRDPSARNPAQALQLLLTAMSGSTSQTNAKAYAAFKRLSDAQQMLLVEHVHVLDGEPSILDVEKEILNELRLSGEDRHLQALFVRLESWWKSRIVEHLAADASDRITGSELLRTLDDLRPQFHEHNLPIDQDILDALAVPALDTGRRIFVEQLRMIGHANYGIRLAIRDYYRAFSQRSRWAREELLHTDELTRYELRLVEAWDHAFAMMSAEVSADASEDEKRKAGFSLYRDLILRQDIRIRRDCDTPFVMRGSFQMLADDTRMGDGRPRIGWHLDFIDRLRDILSPTEDRA